MTNKIIIVIFIIILIFSYKYSQNPMPEHMGHNKPFIAVNPPPAALYLSASATEETYISEDLETISPVNTENGAFDAPSESPQSSNDWAKKPFNYFLIVFIAVIVTSSYITGLVMAGWRMSKNKKR